MITNTIEPKKRRTPEQKEQEMIDDILNNFDFKKCRIVMKLINWSWGFNNEIPTIEQLKSSAVNRLKDAIELAKEERCPKSTYFCSSGGLKGSATLNRYGHVDYLLLEFVLSDWDSDGD